MTTRTFGQVQVAFWSNPDTRACSDDAKLLALYLLTGPHSNTIGCYFLPLGYVSADLRWDVERVQRAFVELALIGFARRCAASDFVFLRNYLRWNPIANPNVAKAGAKAWSQVPKRFEHYVEAAQTLLELGNHWPDAFRSTLESAASTLAQSFENDSQTVHGTVSEQDPNLTYPIPTDRSARDTRDECEPSPPNDAEVLSPGARFRERFEAAHATRTKPIVARKWLEALTKECGEVAVQEAMVRADDGRDRTSGAMLAYIAATARGIAANPTPTKRPRRAPVAPDPVLGEYLARKGLG